MTIDDIVTRVERRLIDLPTRITTESITLVNEAIRTACKRHNFHEMSSTQVYTTVNLTRALGTIPTRFKEKRDKPYLNVGQDTSLGNDPLEWGASLDEALRSFPGSTTTSFGRPQLIVRDYDAANTLDKFWVFPYPDTSSQWDNGLFRISIPFWVYPAALATGQSNYFTDNWEEYLVAAATAEGFSLGWADKRAEPWSVKAAKELKDLIRADKRAKLTRELTLAPFRDVHASRFQGRA